MGGGRGRAIPRIEFALVLAVIHVDAVSVTLLNELVAARRLPVFEELLARGARYELETPASHFPAGAYFTMHSGEEVGDHGLYFSFQWSAAEQRLRYRLEFAGPTTVWERLGRAGRRALLVDPYELGPPRTFSGYAVSGWQYRNILSLERWSVPRGWQRPYERRLGGGPFLQEVFGTRGARSLEATRVILVRTPGRVADLVVEVLRRDRFDVVCASLLGVHQAGHLFWDVSALDVTDEVRARLDGTLPLVYEETDRALGRILDVLPDGADVVVVSPLGMGPNTSRIDLLGDMLERVLAGPGPIDSGGRAEVGSRIWRLRAAVPSPVRAGVARALGGRLARGVTERLSTSGIDWRATRAFLLPSDENGQIRLNLRGREREGIVDPAEADALLAEIRAGLLTFEDIGGGPAVAAVDRSEELFAGRRSHLLPDLVVRWTPTPTVHLAGVRSERYGEVRRRPGAGTGRNGAHTPEAWALVLPGGSRSRAPDRPARVADVAATVAALGGLDSGMPPGEPLLEPGS
jgi:predicted AlkP superfamily phosphohydrolase/phosphomutase